MPGVARARGARRGARGRGPSGCRVSSGCVGGRTLTAAGLRGTQYLVTSARSSPSSAAPRPRVIAVLGMHRSGTSWLAGSLEEMGVELGEVSTADPHNRRGNRESKELMVLHDSVLGDNDGSWKRPPRRREWYAERRAALSDYVARMDAAHALWGFKDPRALLLLTEWRRRVPHLEHVGIYRHPLAVHRSLESRNPRFDRARAVKLWVAYNEALVAECARAPFPLLRFDVPPRELDAQLAAAARALGLAAREAAFFDYSLVHHEPDADAAVPWRCRRLWKALEEHRLRP